MSGGNRRSKSVNPAPPYALHRDIRNVSECRRCQVLDPTLLDPLDPRRIQQQLVMVFLRVRPGNEPQNDPAQTTTSTAAAEEQRKRQSAAASTASNQADRPWMVIRPPNTVLVTRSALPSTPGAATGAPGVGPGPPRVQPTQDIEFRFRRVFGAGASQAQVYKQISESVLRQIFMGGSGLILLTGASGSGKSYSLLGAKNSPDGGILHRCLDSIFRSVGSHLVERYLVQADKLGAGFTCIPLRSAQKLAAKEDQMMQGEQPANLNPNRICRWQLNGVKITKFQKRRACFLGLLIVQEGSFYDLLVPGQAEGRPAPMTLREDRRGRCFALGANRMEIRSAEEADLMIKAALQKREAWSMHGGSHLVVNIYLVVHDNIRHQQLHDCGQLTIVMLLAPRAVHSANTRRPCAALKTVYTLRSCISALHSNQMAVLKGREPRKIPPCRETSLTQLLRHFFDVSTLSSVVCLATISQERDQVLDNMRALRFAQETVYIRDDEQANEAAVEKPTKDDSNYFSTFLDKNFRPNYRAIRTVIPIELPPFEQVQSLIVLLRGQITRRKQLITSSQALSKEFLERMQGRRDEVFALQATALRELKQTIFDTGSLADQLEVVHLALAYGKISVQAQQAEKRAQIAENLLHGRNEQLERHVSFTENSETAAFEATTGDARRRKAHQEEAVKAVPLWHHY